MLEKFATQLKKLLATRQYQNLVVAYSGGVDSQVLMHALSKLAKQLPLPAIQICHIHHGISAHADDWLEFAKAQAANYHVGFLYKKVDLADSNQGGTEAKARELRYLAINQLTDENTLILTGHHLDDQAETFLLAAKRGSGVAGLAAMSAHQVLYGRTIGRPLLTISRDEVVAYAKANDLNWVEDDSNQDNKYDRNFIRSHVLKGLKSRWPAINQTMARSAEFCHEAQGLLEEIAEVDMAEVTLSTDCLSVEKLRQLSEKRCKNLLRYFIALHQGTSPSSAQLEQLMAQLGAEQDKMPEVKVGSCWVRRFHDKLVVTDDFSDVADWKVQVDLSSAPLVEIELPDNIGKLIFEKVESDVTLDNELIFTLPQSELSVQFSHNNPKILPSYREHSRSLKKVFQELSVAPWQRKRTPMIFSEDKLVCISGHFVCKEYLPTKSVTLCKLKWYVN